MLLKKSHKRKQLSLSIFPRRFPTYFSWLIIFAFGFGCAYSYLKLEISPFSSPKVNAHQINVCFSPGNQCEHKIIEAINLAQSEILIQAYVLTSQPIASALINAYKRGISIRILYDGKGSFQKYSQIPFLRQNGIEAKIDKVQGLAHNKILIIDEKILITGSYNFSKAANHRNSENLLIINDFSLAKIYKDNWLKRFNSY